MIKMLTLTRAIKCSLLITALFMVGCASTPAKDANKNLFEQALILQKVKVSTPHQSQKNRVQKEKIQWQFDPSQYQPNTQQKRELFIWFSQIESYSDNPILLQLGPDWVSSYKRGNIIRKMIPRGIIIEQKYDASLPSHEVIFTFKTPPAIALKKGGGNELFSQ